MTSTLDDRAPADASPSIAELLAMAGDGMDRLAAVGEAVADEQQYVTDLVTVYRGRFGQVAAERGSVVPPPEVGRAVALAVEEAGLVADPHRALDWLSTLPQVVLFALGETA